MRTQIPSSIMVWVGHNARLLASAPLLAVVGIVVLTALLNSIAIVRGYVDDNGYHIPIAVEIARHFNPYYVDTNSTAAAFWAPGGAETFDALLIASSHTVGSTNWSGSIVLLLLLFVTYHFAGLWTDDRLVRLLCVALASIIPILLAQTLAFYVDIHLHFLVLLCMYFYSKSLITEKGRYAYLGMSTAFLTAAVKYHGLIFCVILIPIGIYCVFRAKENRLDWAGISTALISGLYSSGWYVRNLLLKGNPIYSNPLPEALRFLPQILAIPYQSLDFPNMSPATLFPQPYIPKTLGPIFFAPDMAHDAFGVGFPIALAILCIAVTQAQRLPSSRRRILALLLGATVMIVVATPLQLSVPRYLLFVPVVAAMSPAILNACAPHRKLVFPLLYAIVLILCASYVQINLLDGRTRKTMLQNDVGVLRQGRDASIAHFDFVDKGNLRIGYVNGWWGFIATLYDRNLTNQLIQLHYQNHVYNVGPGFSSPEELIKHIQSLNLDYIVIFDDTAPGVQIILSNFPDKTVVNKFRYDAETLFR